MCSCASQIFVGGGGAELVPVSHVTPVARAFIRHSLRGGRSEAALAPEAQRAGIRRLRAPFRPPGLGRAGAHPYHWNGRCARPFPGPRTCYKLRALPRLAWFAPLGHGSGIVASSSVALCWSTLLHHAADLTHPSFCAKSYVYAYHTLLPHQQNRCHHRRRLRHRAGHRAAVCDTRGGGGNPGFL